MRRLHPLVPLLILGAALVGHPGSALAETLWFERGEEWALQAGTPTRLRIDLVNGLARPVHASVVIQPDWTTRGLVIAPHAQDVSVGIYERRTIEFFATANESAGRGVNIRVEARFTDVGVAKTATDSFGADVFDPRARSTMSAPGLMALALAGGAVFAGAAGVFVWLRQLDPRAAVVALARLYTRAPRDPVLALEARRQVLAAVVAEPGIHFRALKRTLGMANGQLRYHLQVLEREGLIMSARQGARRVYAPTGGEFPPPQAVATQQRILALLQDSPLSAQDLGADLGITRQAVVYHLKRLVEEGTVDRAWRKGRWRYRLSERAPDPAPCDGAADPRAREDD